MPQTPKLRSGEGGAFSSALLFCCATDSSVLEERLFFLNHSGCYNHGVGVDETLKEATKIKAVVIYTSIAHGNTAKVAGAIVETLKAEPVETEKVNPDNLSRYGLVGFGSGVYNGTLHKDIFDLIAKLPEPFVKKAFIFSTSGYGTTAPNDKLKAELVRKGFDVVGNFACKGLDNYGAMKLFGGVAKGRPNDEDLEDARAFARTLQI